MSKRYARRAYRQQPLPSLVIGAFIKAQDESYFQGYMDEVRVINTMCY